MEKGNISLAGSGKITAGCYENIKIIIYPHYQQYPQFYIISETIENTMM